MGSIIYLLQKAQHKYKVMFADLDPFQEINTFSQIHDIQECRRLYLFSRYLKYSIVQVI